MNGIAKLVRCVRVGRRNVHPQHHQEVRVMSTNAVVVDDDSSNNQYSSSKISGMLPTLQQECWDSYIASSRGCQTLFKLIDCDDDGYASNTEIGYFLKHVNSRGVVNIEAKRELEAMAEDHPLVFEDFQSWLIRATKFHNADKNSRLKHMYEHQPDLGQQQQGNTIMYTWNMSTMSQSLRRMQYAVRGEVVMRADKLAAEGRDVIFTNIGNPHAVGQKPITFYRQVLALCDLPPEYGIQNDTICQLFPKDVLDRATEMRNAIGKSGTGAYTNSQGITQFRQDVADFIRQRDGHPSYPGNIFLTNGASSAIEMVLSGLIANNNDAIMIPIPQYPIYSALISRLGGRQVGYFLKEDLGWIVTEQELEQKYKHATMDQGLNIKAMAIINPGNPTGQVLDRNALQVICKFCAKHGIVLLADEVYQRNVYHPTKEFISAKKVALETPGCETLQIVSFHSTSKGLIGECGRRGGYMELHHIDPYVQSQLYKLASSGLCSGVAGQIMTSLMVKPPPTEGQSYQTFVQEEADIMESLKRRAKTLVDGLNQIDGMECQMAEGAMYAFPRLTNIPPKAIEEASKQQQTPDTLYALSLLEETGICVVPASGFGQEHGRIGFRTTFLPPEHQVIQAVSEIKRHHELFCHKYS